jgi:hypothetical protein
LLIFASFGEGETKKYSSISIEVMRIFKRKVKLQNQGQRKTYI